MGREDLPLLRPGGGRRGRDGALALVAILAAIAGLVTLVAHGSSSSGVGLVESGILNTRTSVASTNFLNIPKRVVTNPGFHAKVNPHYSSNAIYGKSAKESKSLVGRETPRLAPKASVVSEPETQTAKATLEEYVKSRGGNRPIKRVLIANNGMAATKAMLSMKQWAFLTLGDDKAVEFVAMATPEDLNANAEFIRLANEYVEVPGGKNSNNYANVELICKVATEKKVDAVWPGWGHASEKPELPDSLSELGIKFIGPDGRVMSLLGDKIAANILAQTADVPSIPWSGDGLTADLDETGRIPKEIFNKAMVTTADEAVEAANRIGYPVMLKASEGGGGKGIRMSDNDEELRNNFVQVSNEVPGSPMFMMQLCKKARHIEVQIVGDAHGNAVALNGRDCSTQRRFQKIFEEGPPTIVPPATFKEMERAAQRLTQSIGYQGAGTVEYLFNAESGEFSFLELNPRLQVEHPVTEGLTQINMPATQLQVAMGIPLTNIPDVQKFYGRDPSSLSSEIDFMKEDYRDIDNHVIAARITAENPDDGFKPTSGRIERINFKSTSKVWGYFSVGANGGIHEFADSQFGHLFASGADREEARKHLILALKELEVKGDIRTAVTYLGELLQTGDFKDNTIDTSWLDGLIKAKQVKTKASAEEVALASAAVRAYTRIKDQMSQSVESLQKGQTGLSDLKTINQFPVEITFEDTKYSFAAQRLSKDTIRLEVNGRSVDIKIREQPDGSLLMKYGGYTHKVNAQEEPLGLRLTLDSQTIIVPTVFDPSELRSDITGKIVRYLHNEGDEVEKGEPYVEVEAMKMIMSFPAGETGKISHRMSPGSVIGAGDLLASLELKDPSKVKKILPYEGTMESFANAETSEENAQFGLLQNAMNGFTVADTDKLVAEMLTGLDTAEQAFEQLQALIDQFLGVEERFDGVPNKDDVILQMAKDMKSNLAEVVDTVIAHRNLKSRCEIVSALLRGINAVRSQFDDPVISEELLSSTKRLSELQGKAYGQVALEAKDTLAQWALGPFKERLARLRQQLESSDDLAELSKSSTLSAGVDLLGQLFVDSDPNIREKALKVYALRTYRPYRIIDDVDFKDQGSEGSLASFSYKYSGTADEKTPVRKAFMKVIPSFDTLESSLGSIELPFETVGDSEEPLNTVHITFTDCPQIKDSELPSLIEKIEKAVASNAGFQGKGIRNVVVMLNQPPSQPRYLNLVYCNGFKEDPLRRDMRPAIPHLFELNRMQENFNLERIPTTSFHSQVYLGTEKTAPGKPAPRRPGPQTLFVRSMTHEQAFTDMETAEKLMLESLDEAERALLSPKILPTVSSRLFLHVLPEQEASTDDIIKSFKTLRDKLVAKYSDRLLRLKIDEFEIKVMQTDKNGERQPLRLVASSLGGQLFDCKAFQEEISPVNGVPTRFSVVYPKAEGELSVIEPYSVSDKLQMKRANCRRIGTTYAYDFLGLMEVELLKRWEQHLGAENLADIPEEVFQASELIMDPKTLELKEGVQLTGTNNVGMIGWKCTMKTPEYPEGREVVAIANDITFQSGSFGVLEDEFFYKASSYARERGLPRVFISANSGARIGLYEDLKPKFKAAWTNPDEPDKGFEYLYLSEEDYKEIPQGAVVAHEVEAEGEKRYVLEAIVGDEKVHGIGVENLRGSGMIAGETSRAYDEVFTLSYITGRSVGIGAYLNRLGQRTIQMQNGPMILTGYSALNKLLGREVYTSQDQLGGPQVMYPNGVSHEVVEGDRQGVESILDWLSYVPKTASDVFPVTSSKDPVNRPVGFKPTKAPYDPRNMLTGVETDQGWVSGFFDKDSFKETLGGWGKSVVVGRGKLGGIPVGCIAVETRLVDRRIPADPANPESRETLEPQAGQVWFPDSAFKTAQAIEDFGRGENLPLMIFANWRGFSGGTRDMYGEILKFGAKIVDALRKYEQPVFIYIPPAGELRGGAWVVVDPTINPTYMEMYADKESRGGILEPPGICEVKYREGDQTKTMHRLDDQLMELCERLKADPDNMEIQEQIKSREDKLKPIYLNIAHEFADLHDRAGRMKAKGVIRDALSWESSREYFHWRIRRRVQELQWAKKFQKADGSMTMETALARVQSVVSAGGADGNDDKAMAHALEAQTQELQVELDNARKEAITRQIEALQGELAGEMPALA